MDEFKGMSGNWTTKEELDKHYDQPVVNIDSDSGFDTFITVWSGRDYMDDQTRATAKLISKAPELLEMLKDIIHANNQGNFEYLNFYQMEQLIKEATTI